MTSIENAEPFFQAPVKHHSFGYAVLLIFLISLVVSAGYLGTLLYVNQSQNPVEASQIGLGETNQSISAYIPPLQPPTSHRASLP